MESSPCFLSTARMPLSLFCGPNQDPRDIVIESDEQNPNGFNITLDLLPLTKCTNHGNVGFLPLDYIGKFLDSEPTLFQTNPTFGDCAFKVPNIHPIGSSTQCSQQLCFSKCYQCSEDLLGGRDIYMLRDCAFCSSECRELAGVAHDCYKKMMKMLRNEM